MNPEPLHIGVALDGTGWHPAAWREPGARPSELLTADYWLDLVTEAERGLLDFVTFEDSFALQSTDRFAPDQRTDQVRGRLDAVLVAARVAPLTRNIGLIPTAIATHTEPFHLSKAIATLDYVSTGRAGVRIRVSGGPQEAELFGRRTAERYRLEDADRPGTPIAALFDEAADYVEVDAQAVGQLGGRRGDPRRRHRPVRRPREAALHRFRGRAVQRARPVDHAAAAAGAADRQRARAPARALPAGGPQHRSRLRHPLGRGARPPDPRRDPRGPGGSAGRAEETLHVVGDVVVFLDDDAGAAADRKARLDERAGEALRSDALVFTGTPAQLADLRAGVAGGRAERRPAASGVLPHDLAQITGGLVPELQRRGAFRTAYEADTLRGLLGMGRPANRYAAV